MFTRHSSFFGILAGLTAIGIYAGMFTVGRHGAAHGLDGFDQTALRFIVSFCVLIPIAIWNIRGIFYRLGLWRIMVLLVLQGAVYSFIFLAGLAFAPVAYGAALVPGLQPLVVVVLSYLVLREAPETSKLTGLGLCLVGCFVIVFGNMVEMTTSVAFGILLFLLSTLMWGTYTFLLSLWSVRPLDALFIVGGASGLLFLPPYAYFAGDALISTPFNIVLLQALYQGLFVGIIAVLLIPYAVKKIGSIQVAALSPLMPVLATLFASFILGEEPSNIQWFGLGIVSVGLMVSQSRALLPYLIKPKRPL